ncbi:MAG TPA: hypothetical protein VFE47_02730 [Tepidisphaeraceae bacterium]|jgi:hypothetical protein|nr:hypothetical protein [Tepidisphaeraceae bacterium]
MAIAAGPAATQPMAVRDTAADTWVLTDALGRTSPTAPQVPLPRHDRYVAMFYFLWHEASIKQGPFDVTKILAADPLAMTNANSPLWGPMHAMHHWGEPLFGYYVEDDPWVIRKHAQMLSDAGVDVIVFDTSNKLTYRHNYLALFEVYRQMRKEGNRTPQVAFLTPFGDPRSTVKELYDQLYSKGEYEELWFRWDNKPLILADPAKVGQAEREFFTFRKPQPDYFQGPTGPDMWSWLEVYPQHVFKNSRGEKEEMSVGVAQNAVDGRLGSMSEAHSLGRSAHDGHLIAQPGDTAWGYNFAEQWEHAIKEDPQIVFVTGWNEWVAGRFNEFNGVRKPVMFVDEFDQEHSRDIEPMKGGHGDNYYCQLVSFIRRYKGASALPKPSPPKTISMDGPMAQWDDVTPVYRDALYDTAHRDHAGFGHAGPYKDDSGRNDFDTMKVARDSENIYFLATTREPITDPAGQNWMQLLIDIDANAKTGWNGYDFLINRTRPDAGTCSVERNLGGWHWEPVGTARLSRHGRELQIAIPRKLLGTHAEGKLSFSFKWADNTPATGNMMEFYTTGDVAPNGRFGYGFSER